MGEHCLGLGEAGAPCQRRSEGGQQLHGARAEDVGLVSPSERRRRDQDWVLSFIVSHQPLTYYSFPVVRRGEIRDAGEGIHGRKGGWGHRVAILLAGRSQGQLRISVCCWFYLKRKKRPNVPTIDGENRSTLSLICVARSCRRAAPRNFRKQ
jgi:hypothetical protein